ncbi:MAG: RidA family protein [Fimbriimonas ginsengisoli]|uniref:RidA family protein n=1 Tax=Fimbriimonas ginsengisoli TaxID=1005039 RepID=A0A931LWJ7_FIMGI|nr:RidA family protein [Fimbriimonas ginsengisoli]
MERRRVGSGSKWEPIVGYSRAVRVGNQIFVTGTVAFDEQGDIVALGDPYGQAIQCFRNIEHALRSLGSNLHDVVRTRMYVTDISRWEEVGRAHAEVVGQFRPATTMVEVSRLITPEALVEIEADAVVG